MSTESETGINMPTSSPDYKKAVLSSEKDLAANTKNRRGLFGDTGKSWDLAKATMAMTLASLTDGALMDHYTRLSAELDMWHREAACETHIGEECAELGSRESRCRSQFGRRNCACMARVTGVHP